MTVRIDLNYCGACEGGPWHGQRIESEISLINHPAHLVGWWDGEYHHVTWPEHKWVWQPKKQNA